MKEENDEARSFKEDNSSPADSVHAENKRLRLELAKWKDRALHEANECSRLSRKLDAALNVVAAAHKLLAVRSFGPEYEELCTAAVHWDAVRVGILNE